VVIGSAAVEQRAQVAGWMHRFGPERICLAFDVRLDAQAVPRAAHPRLAAASALSLWDAVGRLPMTACKHVLCTDIERDGALAGPNLALYARRCERFPQIAVAGLRRHRHGADLAALAALGVPAAISGKALLEERISLEELRPFLPNA
jgi:phosphoribosylformimino-5-aminoimidazole carboxamide ribotide isomerase